MYAGIDQLVLEESFAASAVCNALEVSRSGFYAWRSTEEFQRAETDRELTPMICEVFWRHPRRYGARRIAMELARRGNACGVTRVARLLKSQGLRAIQPRSITPRTTESRHGLDTFQFERRRKTDSSCARLRTIDSSSYCSSRRAWRGRNAVVERHARRGYERSAIDSTSENGLCYSPRRAETGRAEARQGALMRFP